MNSPIATAFLAAHRPVAACALLLSAALAAVAIGGVPSVAAQARAPDLAQQRAPAPQAVPTPPGQTLQRAPGVDGQRVAVLHGLDKVTARTRRFTAPLGTPVAFGTLTVTARECMVNTPDAPAEAAAFLAIVDAKPGQPPEPLFNGWMFASTPALSALDHSVYDVWVVGCAASAQASAPPSSR